jgi:hypothetical protein
VEGGGLTAMIVVCCVGEIVKSVARGTKIAHISLINSSTMVNIIVVVVATITIQTTIATTTIEDSLIVSIATNQLRPN